MAMTQSMPCRRQRSRTSSALPPGATASIGTSRRPPQSRADPASGLAECVGRKAAEQAGADKTERQEGGTGWPVCLGGGWIAPGHEEAGDQTDPWGWRSGERRGRSPQPALGRLKDGIHTPTDVAMDQGLDPVDPCSHVCQIGKRRPGRGYAHVSAGWLAFLRMNAIEFIGIAGLQRRQRRYCAGR